jgi:hypothetical protein
MDIWSASERVFQKTVANVRSFRELAEVFLQNCEKDALWLFVEISRQIWLCRNKWIHEGEFTRPNEVLRTSAKTIVDYSAAQLGNKSRLRESAERQKLWRKPLEGWVKVNCDASLNKAQSLTHCK